MMEQYSRNTERRLFDAEKSSISRPSDWSGAKERTALVELSEEDGTTDRLASTLE